MAGQDPRDYTYIGSDNDYGVYIGKYHVEHHLGICTPFWMLTAGKRSVL